MAEINGYLGRTHHPNPALQSLFPSLDPISLILHQNSSPDQPVPLRLTTESFIMERGPRYRAYAELRESKLRMKIMMQQEISEREKLTPPAKKQVKFQANLGGGRKGCSALAQSVPDFSAALRKENRKPATGTMPALMEMTPPSKSWSKSNAGLSNSRGSKSASAGEKKGGAAGGGWMARKSYANMEELKGLSSAAASAINGGGGRGGRGMGRTILGHRQF